MKKEGLRFVLSNFPLCLVNVAAKFDNGPAMQLQIAILRTKYVK